MDDSILVEIESDFSFIILFITNWHCSSLLVSRNVGLHGQTKAIFLC
jgi:hypothetical protein